MKIVVAHHSTTPLHAQLLNQLRHLILSGHWAPESRLPSETELQLHLKISRSTIRQALSNAEAEGLIARVPGKGTFVAVSPLSGNTRLIGYITADLLGGHFQTQMLSGAESAARDSGYRILFSNSDKAVAEEDRLIDQFLKDRVAGILIWPTLTDDPARHLFQLAHQNSIPVVLLDRTLPGLVCDLVSSDNFAGAYSAVTHLIQLGHQDIAFLSRPILDLSTVAERYRGYQAALQDAGLTPLAPWFVGREKEVETQAALETYSQGIGQDIEQVMAKLQACPRLTAFFAVNDLMALQALKAASLLGVSVPDELAVVGFDDIDLAAHLEVPLTTVAQDPYSLGLWAAKLLIERIGGYNGPPRWQKIPTQLKIRASTTLTPSSTSGGLICY